MKKMIVLCLMLVLAFSVSARGLKFEAPMINGKAYVDSPVEGEILLDTSDNKFYGYANSSWVDLSASGGSGVQVCYIKDVKASGTAGGTFTSGAWQTRDLNTRSGDISWCSVSSDQFTLSAGKYKIEISTPAFGVENHKTKLVEDPSGSPIDVLIGTTGYSNSTNANITFSFIEGELEILASTTYEVQHRCTNTFSTDGFGRATSYGVDEVYTQVKITKL